MPIGLNIFLRNSFISEYSNDFSQNIYPDDLFTFCFILLSKLSPILKVQKIILFLIFNFYRVMGRPDTGLNAYDYIGSIYLIMLKKMVKCSLSYTIVDLRPAQMDNAYQGLARASYGFDDSSWTVSRAMDKGNGSQFGKKSFCFNNNRTICWRRSNINNFGMSTGRLDTYVRLRKRSEIIFSEEFS